jgi:hypothetical protein
MYDAIMLYLIDMLVLEPNVLRDSILVSAVLCLPLCPSQSLTLLIAPYPSQFLQVRMEIIHYENYVHVNAIMWRVVYRELRTLTNDSTMNLNPMEINDIYEAVWNVGVVLQSDEALSILDLDYRPWTKVKEDTEASTEFYRVHDRNKQAQT